MRTNNIRKVRFLSRAQVAHAYAPQTSTRIQTHQKKVSARGETKFNQFQFTNSFRVYLFLLEHLITKIAGGLMNKRSSVIALANAHK